MTSRFGLKIAIVIAVFLLCFWRVIGFSPSLDAIRQNLSDNIALGLDLKGGTHLILQVQVQDALKSEADQTIDRLRTRLARADISYTGIHRNDPGSIEDADSIEIQLEGTPTDRVSDVRAILDEEAPSWLAASSGGSSFALTLRPSELLRLKAETLQQSMSTIENRINGLGLTEPVIQQHGRAEAEHEILVQLPGVSDPARVMNLLQMSAQLEIAKEIGGPYGSPEAARSQNNGILPVNSELAHYTDRGRNDWYLLERNPIVTGRDLRGATAGRDTQNPGAWQVSFSLSRQAGQRFGIFTAANIGQNLAVVLDNRIQSVASIESRIESEGVINNIDSQTEALDLALVLRAGALPASVVYLEERTVGASLGADSIRQGVRSAIYGVAIIVLMMLVYYKLAGINANVALFFNLLILLAVLSAFGFTLTLPGIAGIILTIGMAVDANVLIFERIREELRAGKAVVAALNAGFGKAFLTIIDTNLTTIIAAAFLFLFGRGPVRGFAVTLAIGLLANLFTSVFVSRLIFDLTLWRKQQVKEMSI
ncbi:MAG: protein translocase subunit SecD [Bryobacterales bacterium]|nr:protein translocase subunit SecD [Bryobacterales bacterium]